MRQTQVVDRILCAGMTTFCVFMVTAIGTAKQHQSGLLAENGATKFISSSGGRGVLYAHLHSIDIARQSSGWRVLAIPFQGNRSNDRDWYTVVIVTCVTDASASGHRSNACLYGKNVVVRTLVLQFSTLLRGTNV